NMSVPKESTKTILARAGLNKILVAKDVKLPAGLAAAEITFVAADKSKIFPLRFGTACDGGMTDVTIAGIRGTLSIERDTAQLDRPKYYFTRKSEGKEVTIKKGEQIIGEKMDSFKDYIPIISMGEYGEWTNAADLIKQQQMLINRAEDKDKFVIMGMVSVPIEEDTNLTDEENEVRQRKANAALDKVMAKKWGKHYINIREALCSKEVIEKAKKKGIKFDKIDLANIKKKIVPDAFRYDKENLNANAYDIIGDIVYDKLVELGYLYH
ncbi:MAG: hypothetical protein IJU04_04405, partial [Ruminococcus sp.]|nr:hypothetical protein [Ruminococcus sp.]